MSTDLDRLLAADDVGLGKTIEAGLIARELGCGPQGCVRSFIRWNGDKFERLDAPHEAIANPLGWRRGVEYWMPSATWHDIFENDEDAALIGAQALRDNGLLRTQSGPSLQCNGKIGNAVKRCYCVSGEILTWAPSSKSYNPARNKLGNELNNANATYNRGRRERHPRCRKIGKHRDTTFMICCESCPL